jgi:probable F420-dependent oxidoreductase
VATPRPFRFGVSTRGARSRDAWLSLARQAEDLGYSTLLIPDHLDTSLAPIAALVGAAGVTTAIRLGCHVFGNDFRHPVMLAKEAATIDALSDGRLELALGTGWRKDDYEESGIPLDPPGVRVSRFAEAIQVVKGCFADQPFSFSGTYYTVHDLSLFPKPVQRPHPPILIGGGSRRVLAIAAREADIVGLNFRTTPRGDADPSDFSAEATAQKVAWVREAAGERFDELELSVFVGFLAVADEPRRAAEQILEAWRLTGKLSVDQLLETPQALVGSVEQIVETLLARRERFGISYIVVRDSDAGSPVSIMETFAPIVARLAGE